MTLAYTLLCAGMLSVASCQHFMLPSFATNYVFTFLITAHGAPKESLYGWCKKNKCPNKAQSGYGDYCKTCFRIQFPEEHSEKCSPVKKHVRSAMLRWNLDKDSANHVGQRAVVATAAVNGLIKTWVQRHAHDALQLR